MSALLDDEFVAVKKLKVKQGWLTYAEWLAGRRLLFTGLEYMPLLKGGPKRWKWTEIILKSDKLIVNVSSYVIVFEFFFFEK